MRHLVKLAIAAMLTGAVLCGVASAQNTTNLSVVVAAAGQITVTNGTNPVSLSQVGNTFTQPWNSAPAASTVNMAYRATKTSGAVTLKISASAVAGAVNTTGAPPLSNFSLTASGGGISTGTLTTTAVSLSTAGTTIFTDAAGAHTAGESFSVSYSLAAGDYAADTYSTTVTYTLTVT